MLPKIVFICISIFLSGALTEAFVCTTTGKFQNAYDPTCKTYYLCGQQMTSTLYKCPNTFDPDTEECSDSYVCEKQEASCTSAGYFPEPGDKSCTEYFNCFNFFGFYIKFSHSCSSGYQFDPVKRLCSSTYNCGDYLLAPEEPRVAQALTVETDSGTFENAKMVSESLSTDGSLIVNEEFVCTASGMFPDKSDKDCSAYFYCIPLTGGTFVKKTYRCRNYFDPVTKKCIDDYNCPHSSTITESFVNNVENTAEGTMKTVEDAVKTDINSNIDIAIEADIKNTSKDNIETDVGSINDEIITTVLGSSDDEMETVQSITELNPSNITESVVANVENTAEGTIKTVEEAVETDINSNIGIAIEDDTKNTFEDNIDTNVGSINHEIITTELELSDAEIETAQSITEVNPSNIAETVVPNVQTTAETDRTNTIDILIEADTKNTSQGNMEVGVGSISNEIITVKLQLSDAETTQSITELDTNEITDATTLVTIEEFVCKGVGRFPDYSDENCSQYFLCSKLHNETFLRTPYRCPSGSYFDPSITKCSKTYRCRETTTETATTNFRTTEIDFDAAMEGMSTTEVYVIETAASTMENIQSNEINGFGDEGVSLNQPESTGVPPAETELTTLEEQQTTITVSENKETAAPTTSNQHDEDTCTSVGKFPNLNDKTCSTYFLCSKRQNGTFLRTPYTCQGSFFDPSTQRCSKDYKCPSSDTTLIQWDFSCSKIGRFENENDPGCKSYFLCSQFRNGTFVRTQYSCPKSSLFNSIKHMCSDMISCVR